MMAKNTSALPGPKDIYREILPNGITVLTRSNFNSPSVVIAGYFDAGSLFDPDARALRSQWRHVCRADRPERLRPFFATIDRRLCTVSPARLRNLAM